MKEKKLETGTDIKRVGEELRGAGDKKSQKGKQAKSRNK